jgi:hypothetical protein
VRYIDDEAAGADALMAPGLTDLEIGPRGVHFGR